jgi:mannose-6-phosphate isomerase-like protein (cupin superfamily)
MPRYTPHTFRNVGDGPGELVELMTPGGLDRYFDAVGHLGAEATDLEARTAIGDAYGISFPTDPGEVAEPPPGEHRRPITYVAPGDGRRVDIGGHEAVVKVEREDADGLHSLLELELLPGGRASLPEARQSLVVVISGEVTVESNGEAVEAEDGDSIAVASTGAEAAATDGRPARLLVFSVG